MRPLTRPILFALSALLFLSLRVPPVAGDIDDDALLWPEAQRAFYQDGPFLLLSDAEKAAFRKLDEAGRTAFIEAFLEEGGAQELAEGIRRRQQLVALAGLSPLDDRAKVLFLQGTPDFRKVLDCGSAFKPLEVWGYVDDERAVALLEELTSATEARKLAKAAKAARLARFDPKRADAADPTAAADPAKTAAAAAPRFVLLYQPGPASFHRVWLPLDSKRDLYTEELEYFLEQYEELRQFIVGRRFDYQICPDARFVDEVTGVSGLFGFENERPKNSDMLAFLAPPTDREAWAREAAATELPDLPSELEIDEFKIQFPEEDGQRLLTRLTLTAPVGGNYGVSTVGEKPEIDLSVEGLLEKDEQIFDVFRVRFNREVELPGHEAQGEDQPPAEPSTDVPPSTLDDALVHLPAGAGAGAGAADAANHEEAKEGDKAPLSPEDYVTGALDKPLALVVEKSLRPGQNFMLRLRVRDAISGAERWILRGFRVPDEAQPLPAVAVPEDMIVAIGAQVAEEVLPGKDSLILIPPDADVIVGLWRAEALITGSRISKVIFKVDGKEQLARARAPFTAEVRLAKYPVEQVVSAEGYDENGELVAADEVILNQPRGSLRVRILDPARGTARAGSTVQARAEVVVPEGRRVKEVQFLINDQPATTLDKPPWQTAVEVPLLGELSYMTVVAVLDDGSRAEDVRFFNTPEYLEEVDVNLVELYTTVTDRTGALARGLTQADFTVLEDGKPQKIVKFELVDNLPLTIGITIDTSGSMVNSIIQAQRAATDFLANIVTRRDKCFALSFASRPVMLMPPTNDVAAVAASLRTLTATGFTSLYDAIVHSLYYFRGVRGRRALVILSDGEDTSSNLAYRDALEYARRAGVAIYTIGLDVGALNVTLKDKLKTLSDETGGRYFFIKNADELNDVYEEIEAELRSQYLVAFSSENAGDGEYREVEVKVQGRGLKARTARGYYQ
jgi:Ca-activated chloride channel homolog